MNTSKETFQNTFIIFFLYIKGYFANLLFLEIPHVLQKQHGVYLKSHIGFLHPILNRIHIFKNCLYDIIMYIYVHI